MITPGELENRAVFGAPPPPTPREASVLALVRAYTESTGEPCSSGYIARRLGIKRQTAYEHIQSLRRKGWLEGSRVAHP